MSTVAAMTMAGVATFAAVVWLGSIASVLAMDMEGRKSIFTFFIVVIWLRITIMVMVTAFVAPRIHSLLTIVTEVGFPN